MDAFLPYFAGFFDGERGIGIYTNGNKHRGRTLRVTITRNVGTEATRLLQEAQRRWGGALTLMNRFYARQAWSWQVSASRAVRALRDMRPWLRLKAEQADVARHYWDEGTFAQRGTNGRFLPLSESVRQQGSAAEVQSKALERVDGLIPPGATAAPTHAVSAHSTLRLR